LVPERLLLAHARGQVLFIAGAGISMPSGLPDFRELVLQVYEALDPAVFQLLSTTGDNEPGDLSDFTHSQAAEIRRFKRREFDVVLGMLERRIDGLASTTSRMRELVAKLLSTKNPKPAPIHRALMKLADRGGSSAIITTNFDLLLQGASSPSRSIPTFSLGGIPRPGRGADFTGVMHIHGALRSGSSSSDVVITDQDFGEFYLRRRVIGDLIYDAARLYHLVLIGYTANDPPMKYLLNSIAADGVRFDDLRERFAFVGQSTADPIELEDWKGRGITPIVYDEKEKHRDLLELIVAWSELSAISGKSSTIHRVVTRTVKVSRASCTESERDLFDHIFRRGNDAERVQLASLVSSAGADISWLEAMASISMERRGDSDYV
jgi:NAD-dependent SIR2 family protein deacetylase